MEQLRNEKKDGMDGRPSMPSTFASLPINSSLLISTYSVVCRGFIWFLMKLTTSRISSLSAGKISLRFAQIDVCCLPEPHSRLYLKFNYTRHELIPAGRTIWWSFGLLCTSWTLLKLWATVPISLIGSPVSELIYDEWPDTLMFGIRTYGPGSWGGERDGCREPRTRE